MTGVIGFVGLRQLSLRGRSMSLAVWAELGGRRSLTGLGIAGCTVILVAGALRMRTSRFWPDAPCCAS